MKQPRSRIAPNIYRYPDGRLEVLLSAAGRIAPPVRFPAKTPIEQIEKWIAAARQKLQKEARELGETPRTSSGTLRGLAPDYFAQIAGKPGTASNQSHLRAWFDVVIDGVALGDLSPLVLTHHHVNKAIAQWQTAPSPHSIRRVRVRAFSRAPKGEGLRSRGRSRAERKDVEGHERTAPATSGRIVAALTIRHRCRVLADFYHTHYTAATKTPVDEAKVPARQKRAPVTVPPEVMRAVLERLAVLEPVTFARFYVASTTGQRPCQVGRAQPDDLQIRDGRIPTWLVRDAKGDYAHTIILNQSQLSAWKAFVNADAWGEFSTSDYGKIIHQAGWPKGIRPYAARHSLAKAALQAGASLNDITVLFGHSDQNTTRIYAPFQIEEQAGISQTLAPYLKDVLQPRRLTGPKR